MKIVTIISRLLVRWIAMTRRFAVAVVLGAVLATVGAGVYLAYNFKMNTETDDLLSPDLPYRKDSRALSAAFPQFSDNILIVVDGDTPDLAEDAARLLTGELRRNPKLFGSVFYPPGDPFFRKNGLLFLDEDELSDLSDRLAEAQPFLGTLWRDPSLRGLIKMLDLAIDETVKGTSDVPIEIAKVLNAMAAVAKAQAEKRFKNLSWTELMTGKTAGESDKRQLILIQPALDFASLEPARKAMSALRRLAKSLKLDRAHGVRVRLTGTAALDDEEFQSVEKGMGFAGLLSLSLVVLLLVVGLKSARLIAATLVTLVMGLIWTAWFAIAWIGELNLISVAFAVLFIGLSVDFGIHFALRYSEAIDHGRDHGAALDEAARGVGWPLVLSAVCAAIAFYAFLPTDYLGLAQLGLIAGTGMFIALAANLTVLPALLTLLPLPPGKPGVRPPARVQPFVRRHPRPIVWGALVLGLAAAALLPSARFDFDPLNVKDPNTESVQTLRDLIKDSHTSPYTIEILAQDLPTAQGLAAKLDRLAVVDGTQTLADFVPKNQEDKLAIIGEMALYLSPALARAGGEPGPTVEDLRAGLVELRKDLARLIAMEGGERTTQRAARRLLAALTTLFGRSAGDAALMEFQTRLLSALPNRLADLKESLTAEPVSLDSLPEDIREREVTADGRARLTVYPKENLQDRKALASFVRAVRAVAPHATGAPVVILEAGNAVVRSFTEAGLLSLALISVLLFSLLRSVRDVLLVYAPLLLAALLTVASTVLMGLSFNYANVIVLPLLFGLGVASGIHLVLREREEGDSAALLATSTPRAVVFSSLTTIGSFVSMALSRHAGTSSMGVLLTIAIALTLVCTLGVLPALMAMRPAKKV